MSNGRTIYLKSVVRPQDAKRLLQPASTNKKLGSGGGTVQKGRWKGMPMYQLTLEERSTCPKTCQQWASCYGNNMPFAKRVDSSASSSSLYSLLRSELDTLSKKHANGFVVRLHVLGDFFSVRYVRFWIAALVRIPNLRIFGYTHRPKDGTIGKEIQKLNKMGAWIRWSDAGDVPMAANVKGPGIVCPEQTGSTESCTTCGLCWTTQKAIQFLSH